MTGQLIVSAMLDIVLLMEILERWGSRAEAKALGNVVKQELGGRGLS